MKTKFFEVRDEGTFIPVMAIQFNGNDSWLVKCSGFGTNQNYIYLVDLRSQKACYNPYDWYPISSLRIAHLRIIKHFDTLENEAVIDVQFLLGETKDIKESERKYYA